MEKENEHKIGYCLEGRKQDTLTMKIISKDKDKVLIEYSPAAWNLILKTMDHMSRIVA